MPLTLHYGNGAGVPFARLLECAVREREGDPNRKEAAKAFLRMDTLISTRSSRQ